MVYSEEKFSSVTRATGKYDTVSKNSMARRNTRVNEDQYFTNVSPPNTGVLEPTS